MKWFVGLILIYFCYKIYKTYKYKMKKVTINKNTILYSKVCPNCGTMLKVNQKVCNTCGEIVEEL